MMIPPPGFPEGFPGIMIPPGRRKAYCTVCDFFVKMLAVFLQMGGCRMDKQILLVNRHWHDINPVDCGREACAPGHSFGPAARFYWLLHYVIQGRGAFTAGGKESPVRAGQMFVIRPFEVSYYEADRREPWEYIWIGFTCGIPLPECLLQEAVVNASRCGSIFSSMLEAENQTDSRELFLCGKVFQLLAALEEKPAGGEDYVEQARTYLEANYMRDVSIGELAGKLNLNRSYFSTLFRKKTGKSPQQYLTDYRMGRACQLMTEHGYSPGKAALSTGYPDIFSFSRMFKKHFGVSPREYSRRQTEKEEFL
ncbi:AraC family transcriptional regulator [Clostridium sp. AM29-11AC]|nr:AraC family transcriptional regulator [Clostridium sp. AM29-11AC]